MITFLRYKKYQQKNDEIFMDSRSLFELTTTTLFLPVQHVPFESDEGLSIHNIDYLKYALRTKRILLYLNNSNNIWIHVIW